MSTDHLYCQRMENIPFSLLLLFSISPIGLGYLLFWLPGERMWNGERGYRTCVCVRAMKRVTKRKKGEMECIWALACWECRLSMSLSLPLYPSFCLSLTNPSLLSVHGNYTIKTLQPKRIIATWVLQRDWEREWVKMCVCASTFSHVCGIRVWMKVLVAALYCIPEVLHCVVRVIRVKDQRICLQY